MQISISVTCVHYQIHLYEGCIFQCRHFFPFLQQVSWSDSAMHGSMREVFWFFVCFLVNILHVIHYCAQELHYL